MEEEVTFYFISFFLSFSLLTRKGKTYDGRDGKLLLLGVLEETENVITDDDAGLAGELFQETHCD